MGRGEVLSPSLPSPVALIAATHGQNGLLTGALLIAAISLLARSHPLLSGTAIGALVIKPHLALLLPFWLLGGRCWRTILTAGAALVALLLASLLAFGTATMRAYTTSWDASAALVAQGGPDFLTRINTYYSQVRVHFGEPAAIGGRAVIALAMSGMALVAFRRLGSDARASGCGGSRRNRTRLALSPQLRSALPDLPDIMAGRTGARARLSPLTRSSCSSPSG